MRVLRWMNGNTLEDRIKNENIQDTLQVAPQMMKGEILVLHGLVMYKRGYRCNGEKN